MHLLDSGQNLDLNLTLPHMLTYGQHCSTFNGMLVGFGYALLNPASFLYFFGNVLGNLFRNSFSNTLVNPFRNPFRNWFGNALGNTFGNGKAQKLRPRSGKE